MPMVDETLVVGDWLELTFMDDARNAIFSFAGTGSAIVAVGDAEPSGSSPGYPVQVGINIVPVPEGKTAWIKLLDSTGEVVWSQGPGECLYGWTEDSGSSAYTDPIGPGDETLDWDPLTVVVGALYRFGFGTGPVFEYLSATSSLSTFLTALEAAMSGFVTAQGSDGLWEHVTVSENGSVLTVEYPDTETMTVQGFRWELLTDGCNVGHTATQPAGPGELEGEQRFGTCLI